MDQDVPPSACYGLACPRRGQCARFAALTVAEGAAIESCQTARGWPLYLPMDRAERLAHQRALTDARYGRPGLSPAAVDETWPPGDAP